MIPQRHSSPQLFAVEVKDILDLMEASIEQGLSVTQLLKELDLPVDYLDNPTALIGMENCWRIITANQNKIHEETHLMSARPLKRGTSRLIFSNLCHCENLLSGLQALPETYNVVHGGNYNFVRRHGNTLSYVVDDSHFHYQIKPNVFAIELALLKIHCAVSYLSGRQLKLVRMATQRKRLPDHHHHLKLFDTHLLIDHGYYELAYASGQAELPFQSTQATDITDNLYAHYLSLLQGRLHDRKDDSFVQRVVQKIRQGSVEKSTRNQAAIAGKVNVSVATLRRRLNNQGTSFRRLLDKVNSELAVNDLYDEMTPADVAEKLGYSDIRSFKRAFRRWYGVSPAAYVKHYQLLQ